MLAVRQNYGRHGTSTFADFEGKWFLSGIQFGCNWRIYCQAMTGLIVALVRKYAATIPKRFATSAAVVLATILSIFIWKARVDAFFIFGGAMVMLAVRIYTMYPSQPPQAKEATGS